MNRQDPSQELMKKRKQRNLDNNNDKLSHAWPRDPQQKWIQTLDERSPLSFFPTQRPSLAVTSISHGLANKQTGRERNDIPMLYINSRSACVCLSVRPVTLCAVTGPEPELLLQFVPEISKRMLQQPVDCHNRRPLWCLFGHLLHFDPLLSFCICGGPGVRLSVRLSDRSLFAC
jgi:hypothetical protein